MDCSKENTKLKNLGQNLKKKYLYNIYNDSDSVEFLEAKFSKEKKINNKILKLIL